jgi:hypothetical protein
LLKSALKQPVLFQKRKINGLNSSFGGLSLDKKVMTVVWQYGLVLVHVCYTITIYASADKKGNAKLLFHKNARFGEMLFAISDKRVAEEHSALYQKRAELDRPQSSIQNHILSLDDNIRYAYKKRVFVNEQLEGYCAKKAALRKAEEDLIINIEKLQKDKEFIARRMGGYGNELKEVQDAEDELCSIEMSSVSKQLAHCQNRIALMCKRKDELRKEVGPLSFNICSLEKEREQWDAYSAELQAKRAELVQIQMICFNDGTRPLLDQFDEMIELSIASAYICPINIFTQLAIKTGDARECAWCFALLKVFQSKDPTYQQIMQHVQNKKRYCDEQDKCTLCDSLNEKRAKVLSKIAKHCLQQLKHDKVYRVCLGCSDSLIKTENLLRKKAFVDYVEQIVPDYIAFRLDYLELFLKHDVKLNIYSKKLSS